MVKEIKLLRFDRESWDKPVIYRLTKDYELVFSILKAKVLPRQESMLILELSGEEEDFRAGITYLKKAGIVVESIEQEIARDDGACTHCGACVAFCPSGALRIDDRSSMEVAFHPEDCIACETCMKGCPCRAMRFTRALQDFTAEERI